MTNHPNRGVIIHSLPRNAFPGDTARVMRGPHTDIDGTRWDDGTEYQPLSSGTNNTKRGAPSTQVVSIGARKVTFVGRDNVRVS